jgi:hypothetical protein
MPTQSELVGTAQIRSCKTRSNPRTLVFNFAPHALIRTFLSLSLQLEIEGRLPWQRDVPHVNQD